MKTDKILGVTHLRAVLRVWSTEKANMAASVVQLKLCLLSDLFDNIQLSPLPLGKPQSRNKGYSFNIFHCCQRMPGWLSSRH